MAEVSYPIHLYIRGVYWKGLLVTLHIIKLGRLQIGRKPPSVFVQVAAAGLLCPPPEPYEFINSSDDPRSFCCDEKEALEYFEDGMPECS